MENQNNSESNSDIPFIEPKVESNTFTNESSEPPADNHFDKPEQQVDVNPIAQEQNIVPIDSNVQTNELPVESEKPVENSDSQKTEAQATTIPVTNEPVKAQENPPAPKLVPKVDVKPMTNELRKANDKSKGHFRNYINPQFKTLFNISRIVENSVAPVKDSQVVEVIFKCKRKAMFWNDANLKFYVGEYVVVEVEGGIDIGTISASGSNAIDRLKKNYNEEMPTQKALRHATKEDFDRYIRNLENEPIIIIKSKDFITKYNLDMKVTDAEWQLDHQRLTIYFTAPQRIDFRDLVKDLARVFKTRIELRQISTREEAKRMGGMGSCGRNLCCSSFCCEFCHVTLDHARTQQLSNNVAKLSGYCGRLKCCLLYEYDTYIDSFKNYPALNSIIDLPEGKGRLIKADIFKDLLTVQIVNNSTTIYKTFPLDEINALDAAGKITPPPQDEQKFPPSDLMNGELEGLKQLED